MTPAVDVIVDRNDDIATVRAIHRLAAGHPAVLAISLGPDSRAAPAVVWAILRALGKRTEKLAGHTPRWCDAEVWLTAHGIMELVVLRAQHLAATRERELEQLGKRAGITITLVYSGPEAAVRQPTIALGELLGRPRQSSRAEPRLPRWPRVPRSHPLRLRYDCAWTLPAEQFQSADRLLCDGYLALAGWLAVHPRAPRARVAQAVAVVSVAHDHKQRHIRQCAIGLALLSAGITPPPPVEPPIRAHPLSDTHIAEALAYTSPPHAGYALAEQLTSLPPDLLDLIGGDQITDDAILGLPVPEPARPVLRALKRAGSRVLEPPRDRDPDPAERGIEQDRLEAAISYSHFAAILAKLLGGRRQSIAATRIPKFVRTQLDELRADDLIDLERGVYRASAIALYSSYRLPSPPSRRLTNEWEDPLTSRGNAADI